jgi:hypothetical protein
VGQRWSAGVDAVIRSWRQDLKVLVQAYEHEIGFFEDV